MRKATWSALVVVLALVLAVVSGGCGIADLWRQTRMVEQLAQLSGRVELRTRKQAPVTVVVAQAGATDTDFMVRDTLVAEPNGSFRFPALPPGIYLVGAFVDSNGDGAAQPAVEPAAYYNTGSLAPLQIRIAGGDKRELPALVITGPLRDIPDIRSINGSPAATRNIGRVVSLKDPMFSKENATMGLWRPVEFLLNVGGGLFMLEDYDATRIPVVFVHGINGNPGDWRRVIAALDTTRFQPWLLHYPSGLRLDIVSEYLDRAVDVLHRRHGFKKLYVVAHSMGGLIARSFVVKHDGRRHGPVALLMTINSPMRGMASAIIGVEMSPIVVPVWRDVAADSAFVRELASQPLPDTIPYHLVFSWKPGKGDDGVVPLESQLPLELQSQAVHIQGFDASHAGVLKDRRFHSYFLAVLDELDRRGKLPSQPRPPLLD